MSIPGSAISLLLSSGTGGYEIERSLRFNSADSAYLSRTPASAGNRKTWTWAGWVKRSKLTEASYPQIFGHDNGSSNYTALVFDANADTLSFYNSGVNPVFRISNVLRDPSAWYHIMWILDTTQATASNRTKLYINGVEVSYSTDSRSSLSQNSDLFVNSTVLHTIGSGTNATARYFNGYLADVHFIDGQALDPTSFGEFDSDTGVWNPVKYNGTYGQNGFHLDFSDNSAATATTLGADSSGNGNNWTPNNFSTNSSTTTYSSYVTSSTGAFFGSNLPRNLFDGNTATVVDPSTQGGTITFTPPSVLSFNTSVEVYQNSSAVTFTLTAQDNTTTTYSKTTGSGWFTVKSGAGTLKSLACAASPGVYCNWAAIRLDGVILVDPVGAGNDSLVDSPTNYGTDTGAGGEVRGNYCTWNPNDTANTTFSNGNLLATVGGGGDSSGFGNIGVKSGKYYWEVTPTTIVDSGLLIGIAALDQPITSRQFNNAYGWYYYALNGNKYNNLSSVSYGSSYVANDVIGVALDMDSGTVTFYKNGVSQGVAYSTGLSGRTIAPAINTGTGTAGQVAHLNTGQRPFAYPAPSGFKSICTTNLPTPTIENGSDYFDTKLYTGNGSTQTISGLAFSPDLVWIKRRDTTGQHVLTDTVRGNDKQLFSSLMNAEQTSSTAITAFNSDGFSLGANPSPTGDVNGPSGTFAAWAWDAGSSTVTNNDGSITSQVRANPSAGFSIVTYTGSGNVASTVGHGLGVTPGMIILKSRNLSPTAWVVAHASLNLASQNLHLNDTTAASSSGYGAIGSWSSTVFGFRQESGTGDVNGLGYNYVAYCFAPVEGYSAIGSYVGNGSADGPFVYTGFRPRWILFKRTDAANGWFILDTARDNINALTDYLEANSANAEGTSANIADSLSNGFKVRGGSTYYAFNAAGGTYVYLAFAENPFSISRAR